MAREITGGPQITRQGTLVGSLCCNTPASEMPGVAVALEGRLRIAGDGGLVRDVRVSDFLTAPETVDLRPGEFVRSLVVTRAAKAGYCKLKHAAGSWPIATASAVFDATGAGVVTLGAVQGTPLRVPFGRSAEALPELVEAALTDPWDDVLAPGRYRAAVAKVVAVRAARELMEEPHE